jgi:hypothetical protein
MPSSSPTAIPTGRPVTQDIPDTLLPTVELLEPCNICGDNMMIGNPAGIIFVEGFELTCAQAEIALELGNISEGACQLVQDAAIVACDCQGTCNICGDEGLVIGNPGALISFDLTCAEAQAAATEGSVTEEVCEVLQDSADCCNCRKPGKGGKGGKGGKVSNTTGFLFTGNSILR